MPLQQNDMRTSGLTALVDVIDAVTAEVQDLAVSGERLQRLASNVAGAASNRLDPDLIEDLQGADLIVQRLHAVSSFLRGLAPSLPSDCFVDAGAAAGGLTLEDTKRRLQGLAEANFPMPAGDCDLF
jgi:hypothetical protein